MDEFKNGKTQIDFQVNIFRFHVNISLFLKKLFHVFQDSFTTKVGEARQCFEGGEADE